MVAAFCAGIAAKASAQDATVKGLVSGNKNAPVSFATVTLLNEEDSSLVNGAITEENGRFEIQGVNRGNYMLRLSGIGFNTKIVPGIIVSGEQATVDLGRITVTVTTQVMKEVEISGAKPMMEVGIDKKVFNVDKNITSTGGSASDVLQNVPSVTVDVDGGVSLRGKSNVTILIDGRPATLLGGDETTALQSLPAASIEQVEVITNPSAKYDASGMGGIINIITKKEKKLGMNGSVTAGAGTRDKYNGSINLNVKNNKWNIFLNSSARQNRNYRRNTTGRDNKFNDGYSFSTEDNVRMFNGFFNSLGAEYKIDTNNTITLTQNINKMYHGGKGSSDFSVYDANGDFLSRQLRGNKTGGGPVSSSTSLDYKHKFAKVRERELTANTTYVRSFSDRQQEYVTNLYNASGALVQGPINQDAPGTSNNNSWNTQLDFTTPLLTKTGKLDAGLKSQMFWLGSSNNPTIDSAGGDSRIDTVLLNGYDYQQHIYAAYTNWGDKIGKLRYQAGLRMEYAFYEGTAMSVGGKRYFNKFLNLFPSAFVSYELPKDQSIYLNYTRRISRPRFWDLLPFVDLSNPQDTSIGNPGIIPEFVHNIELSYNKLYEKGHSVMASTYYQYTQNLITNYRIIYGDGTSFTQRRNLNAGLTYGFELTGQVQLIKKIWDVSINTNFFRNEILGSSVDPLLNNSGFGWFGKLNTTIRMPKDFSLQVNGNYEGPKVVAQGTRHEVYWIDVALRKNMLKGKANLVLNVSDIFNTRKYTTDFDFGTTLQTNYNDRETRIGNISFTYRFGKTDNGQSGSRKGRNGKSKKTEVTPDVQKDRDNIRDKDDDKGNGGGNSGT